MKSAIVYVSVHHGNTKKVAEAMADELEAELIDLAHMREADLAGYDLVGLASGVFYHGLHKKMAALVESGALVPGQRVFVALTCGVPYRDYARGAKRTLAEQGVECLGSFQCRGFDTFGPFEKVGGIAKGRPNERDLARSREFARSVAQKAAS